MTEKKVTIKKTEKLETLAIQKRGAVETPKIQGATVQFSGFIIDKAENAEILLLKNQNTFYTVDSIEKGLIAAFEAVLGRNFPTYTIVKSEMDRARVCSDSKMTILYNKRIFQEISFFRYLVKKRPDLNSEIIGNFPEFQSWFRKMEKLL